MRFYDILFLCLLVSHSALKLNLHGQPKHGQPNCQKPESLNKDLRKIFAPSGNCGKINDFKVAENIANHTITDDMIWKSWHDSHIQNEFRLQQAMQKLLHGTGPVTIAVLGGSITKGGFWKKVKGRIDLGGCVFENAWPSVLNRTLQETFGDRVTVANLAKPATTSGHVISNWKQFSEKLSKADVVIAEYNFNEQFGTRDTQLDNEMLLSMVLSLPNAPAFLYLDLPGPEERKKLKKKQFPRVQESIHWKLAKRFGVPIIWYPHLENAFEPPFDWNAVHPGCTAHLVMATQVQGVLKQAMTQVCKNGVQGEDLPVPEIRDKFYLKCAQKPVLSVFATTKNSEFPVQSAGKWVYLEDRPGKPGWIAQAGTRSEIVFTGIPVQLGGLEIEYLQTYENIGSVMCALETNNTQVKAMKLDGLIQKCASQSVTSRFSDIPTGTYDLRCTSDGSKFKLTGIMSC